MKQWLTRIFTASMLILLGSWLSYGQGNLKDAITGLAGPAAKEYTKPLTSGFGSNLNSGWFHRSPKAKKLGIDIEVGFVMMGTLFSKKDQSFTTEGAYQINKQDAENIARNYLYSPSQTPTWFTMLDTNQRLNAINAMTNEIKGKSINVEISGPTFIGKKSQKINVTFKDLSFKVFNPNGDSVLIDLDDRKEPLKIGGVVGEPVVPLVAPQVTIGTVMGTQLTVRYLPPVTKMGKVGKINYLGWGIQHNPGVWFNDPLPVDLAFAFYQQNINQGKLFEAHAIAYGITVSKQIGFGFLNITPYAGYLQESSKMKFTYTYSIDPADPQQDINIKFSEKGANKNRITVGANFKFLLININADYSFAKKSVYSAGVNFSI